MADKLIHAGYLITKLFKSEYELVIDSHYNVFCIDTAIYYC